MEQKFRKDLASIMARKKREKYVYEARIAKAAHRPNDMVDAVKKLALLNVGLTTDERNLFSTAYHLKIGALRRARKRASSFGKNETSPEKIKLINDYQSNCTKETRDVWVEVIFMIENHILPYESNPANRICYFKWKGDCYRLLGEFMTDTFKRTFYEKSLAEYNAAFYISSSIFPPQNEIRLGLALKLSEVWRVMFNDVFKAYEIARAACYDAFNAVNAEEANKNPFMVSSSKNLAKLQLEILEIRQFQSQTSQISNEQPLDHEPYASASNQAMENESRASASNAAPDYEPRASTSQQAMHHQLGTLTNEETFYHMPCASATNQALYEPRASTSNQALYNEPRASTSNQALYG